MQPDQTGEITKAHTTAVPEVVFSQEGKRVLVKIYEINALFTDINRFNGQFSMPSLLVSLFRFHAGSEEDLESLKLSSLGEQAQMLTAAGIKLIHDKVLDRVGLAIEPVSGKHGVVFAEGQEAGVGEIRINIMDRSRFLSFLRALNSQHLQDSDLRNNLQKLSDILVQQICDHYNLHEPSDEALQLLGSLGNIVNEYKRLGIEGTERPETYLKHARQGDLREYILIEREGLLSEPGKYFGPADWQKDAGPDFLKARWNRALRILQMARENPNAQDFYHQLYAHLSKCLDIAIENLEKLEGGGYTEKYKGQLRPVLQRVKQAFGL